MWKLRKYFDASRDVEGCVLLNKDEQQEILDMVDEAIDFNKQIAAYLREAYEQGYSNGCSGEYDETSPSKPKNL